MHVKILLKNEFVKMCGPQIQRCLFTFRPIALQLLNSKTTIDNLK